LKEYVPYVSLIVSIAGFIYLLARNWSKDHEAIEAKLTERHEKFEREIRDSHAALDKRMVVSEYQLSLFVKNLTVTMGNVLHSPHTPRLDYLIDRHERDELTEEEAFELIDALKEIKDEKHKKNVDTVVAALMLNGLEQLQLMRQNTADLFARAVVEMDAPTDIERN
jgi:hypothetical protein